MSIYGVDYADHLTITEDLYMNLFRIKELRNPQEGKDAVNKRYVISQIKGVKESVKDNETKITSLQQILDGTNHMTTELDMGNNRIKNVAHPKKTKSFILNMKMM